MKIYKYILLLILGVVCSCSEIDTLFNDSDALFESGEEVLFTTNVPRIPLASRAVDNDLLQGYKTIQEPYVLAIEMWEKDGETEKKIGSTCNYKPKEDEEATNGLNSDGLLRPEDENSKFFWESNIKSYAFKATAGTETLESDQGDKEKWLSQDRLEGFGFVPNLNNESNRVDNLNALNYHTNKEWYKYNQEWHDSENQMLATEAYKRIPLFLQHKRSWITLKLKAGNGVKREDLKFEEVQKNCKVVIFSYKNGVENPTEITSQWLRKGTIDYEKDKNGEAQTGVETTVFNAIVEPFNYLENAAAAKIATISLSGLNFTFFAANDMNYKGYVNSETAAVTAMAPYNLQAGKHLTITATLTTDRIVFITSWIEDWTEVATQTVCDDYGQKGDPILINSRQDLIDFLQDPEKNKQGNIAIIVAKSLDLDKKEDGTDDAWTNYYSYSQNDESGNQVQKSLALNATLNMAGAELRVKSQFLSDISQTGSIVNGSFMVTANGDAPVPSAITKINSGSLERISVFAAEGAKASKAGLVETNYGTVYLCSSALPVYGNEENGVVGGIAAESKYFQDTAVMPVIDGCTVSASVNGEKNKSIIGGGIVGKAEGRVTNNKFTYGITLLQVIAKFKNIIGEKLSRELRASNNWWPTKAENSFDGDGANVNANTDAQYDNVLDSQEELAALLSTQHNQKGKKYKISNSFTVCSETWKYGSKHDNLNSTSEHPDGNLLCELDGNNMTITLDGTETVEIPTGQSNDGKATATESKTTCSMLFSNIMGSVHDLTIYLAKPLIAKPSTNANNILNAVDAIAPLAYAVTGENAKISNIKVKMAAENYIQAAMPAGVVCWAYGGATVEKCQVKGTILSWLPKTGVENEEGEGTTSDAIRYAGGIVALAAKASIRECIFHSSTNTLKQSYNTSNTVYYGGILGGTRQKKSTTGNTEDPEVSLIDCISWLTPSDDEKTKGTVIGYAVFTKDNKEMNGTVTTGNDACQGNWWNTTYPGVVKKVSDKKIEEVIGTCNSYTPKPDTEY